MNVCVQRFKKTEPIYYGLGGKRITETKIISKCAQGVEHFIAYQNGAITMSGVNMAGPYFYSEMGERTYALDVVNGKVITAWVKL